MACNVLYAMLGFSSMAFLFTLGSCLQDEGNCRTLKFGSALRDKALVGHLVKSYEVNSRDDCELQCYMESECTSINFGLGANGKYLCELSSSDHELHPQDLKHRSGFIFGPTLNFCVNNQCSSNSRCQTGFADRGYRCVCSAGYTGEYCTEGVLGKVSTNPGNSCKDIMERGAATGDGEYWIDPQKNGDPLKVYCDMTTDGGGWLLVVNIVADGVLGDNDSWTAETSYRGISNYHNQRMAITGDAMKGLRAYLKFTQLRFHCSKKQGNTFHVITAPNSTRGEAVVRFFSAETDVQPFSCNSFKRMSDDNSKLAVKCEKWGRSDGSSFVGKWSGFKSPITRRMHSYVAFFYRSRYVGAKVNGHIHCDDYVDGTFYEMSAGDFFKIYVR